MIIAADRKGSRLLISVYRPRQRPGDAAAAIAPDVTLEPVDDYVMISCSVAQGTVIPPSAEWTDGTPAMLRGAMLAAVEGWHPAARALVAGVGLDSIFVIPFGFLKPAPPWEPSRVTLVGDAAHAMLPTSLYSTTRPPSPRGDRSSWNSARSTRSTTGSRPRTASGRPRTASGRPRTASGRRAYGIAPGAYRVAPGAVSHVSWVVPDLEQECARLAQLGCRLINTARSGPILVAWHHGGPLFPHPIELHQHNDVIAGMHDRLAALRRTDDR